MTLARLRATLLPIVGLDYAGKAFVSPSGPTSGLSGYSLEGQKKRRLRVRGATKLALGKATTDEAAHEAATSPFNLKPKPDERALRSGRYEKGRLSIAGLRISIENPAGSRRRQEWEPLTAHYGYVERTRGMDGDAVDVFVRVGTPEDWNGIVFLVGQVDARGAPDEYKVMLGWPDAESARRGYLSNYEPGWDGLGGIVEMTVDEFKDWLRAGAKPRRSDFGKCVPAWRDGALLVARTPSILGGTI